MKKRISLSLIFLLTAFALSAQDYFELPLRANAIGENTPSLRVYLAENPNGAAIISCPGGGYAYLAIDKEGYAFAPWCTEKGITYIVLNYGLPNGNSEIPLADAKQAMRLVRAHAEEWKVDTAKIGIMGFSAGGHLASTLATHFDADTRPAFQILFYPVVTMDETFTHRGSRDNLLGKNPTAEQVELYSNEKQVTPQTPPAFLLLNDDDGVVPSKNGINYYLALKANKVPSEMHVYPSGGHGWGVYPTFKYYNQWTNSLQQWLKDIHILP